MYCQKFCHGHLCEITFEKHLAEQKQLTQRNLNIPHRIADFVRTPSAGPHMHRREHKRYVCPRCTSVKFAKVFIILTNRYDAVCWQHKNI